MKPVVGSRSRTQITFVGPFGVGKTTAVVTLCNDKVTASEVKSSLASGRRGRRIKSTTTVGLEVGEWTAPDGRKLSLVGTPSQERFDTVRRSAMPRSAAVVLWLFGDHEYAELDAQLWLEFILTEVPAEKVSLAITRLGDDPEERLEVFRKVADAQAPGIPVVAADPREVDQVAAAVVSSLRITTAPTPAPGPAAAPTGPAPAAPEQESAGASEVAPSGPDSAEGAATPEPTASPDSPDTSGAEDQQEQTAGTGEQGSGREDGAAAQAEAPEEAEAPEA